MPHLIIQTDDGALVVHELRPGRVTVGRDADNTIVIRSASVSRHHAEFILSNGVTTVRDLRSANGSMVNYTPVIEAPLHSGVIIHFGLVQLTFVVGAVPPSKRPNPAALASGPVIGKSSPPKRRSIRKAIAPRPPAKKPVALPKPVSKAAVVPSRHKEAIPPTQPASKTAITLSPSLKELLAQPTPPTKAVVASPPPSGPPATPAQPANREPTAPPPPAQPSAPLKPANREVIAPQPRFKEPAPLPKSANNGPSAPPPPSKDTVVPAKPTSKEAAAPRPPSSASVAPAIPTSKTVEPSHPPTKAPGAPAVPPRVTPVPSVPSAKTASSQENPRGHGAVAPAMPGADLSTPSRTPRDEAKVSLSPAEGSTALPEATRKTAVVSRRQVRKRRLLIGSVAFLVTLSVAIPLLSLHLTAQRAPSSSEPTVQASQRPEATKEFWTWIQQIKRSVDQQLRLLPLDQYPTLRGGMYDFQRIDNDHIDSLMDRLTNRAQHFSRASQDLASIHPGNADPDLVAYSKEVVAQWESAARLELNTVNLVWAVHERRIRFPSAGASGTGPDEEETSVDYSEPEKRENQDRIVKMANQWVVQRDQHLNLCAVSATKEKATNVLLSERYKSEFQ